MKLTHKNENTILNILIIMLLVAGAIGISLWFKVI
jgi:hypothetical protein